MHGGPLLERLRGGVRRSPLGVPAVAGHVVLVVVVLTEEPGEAAVRAGQQGRGGGEEVNAASRI
ncbi:hypothetical protein [Streptomyces sp. NPDC006551]|uniref:hypothetical protein n=1 Tax=Streptomyces sp. NPDC006551 TaxID=3157178 RepID=UPI0033B093DA